MKRSRNSHIRAPRSVTAAPISCPSRRPKFAIDFFAFLRTGRWPVMTPAPRRPYREAWGCLIASPRPTVQHDLLEPRNLMRVRRARTASSAARAPSSRSSSGGAAGGTGTRAPRAATALLDASPALLLSLWPLGCFRCPCVAMVWRPLLASALSLPLMSLRQRSAASATAESPRRSSRRGAPSFRRRRSAPVRVGSPDFGSSSITFDDGSAPASR